jgi:hypothetical protein
MATTTTPHTVAPRTGTRGPSGLRAVFSSEPALGSTVLTTSTATLITALIRITATLVHIRNAETSPSIISTETRCGMGAATPAVEAIARNGVKLKGFDGSDSHAAGPTGMLGPAP